MSDDSLKMDSNLRALLLECPETVLIVPTGSRLYGTDIPTSDFDYRGLLLPTKTDLLGLRPQEQVNRMREVVVGETATKIELSLYPVRRWVELVLTGNPTVIEMAFVRSPIKVDPFLVEILRWVRMHARNARTAKAYHGYITHHFKDWSKRKDGWVSKTFNGGSRIEMYRAHGYDLKMASHIVRLGFQVNDLLERGDFNPTLVGAQLELVRAMRNGEIPLADAVEVVSFMVDRVEKLLDDRLPVLPEAISEDLANAYMVKFHQRAMNWFEE